MDVNLSSSGGDELPSLSYPQQVATPSPRKPQAWTAPPVMEMKRLSLGGEESPNTSEPRQTAVPSARNPQVYPPWAR